MNKFIENLLTEIYSDGEVDWISAAQILSAVSFNSADVSLGKPKLLRIIHAIRLAELLCASGDFEVGQVVSDATGTMRFHSLNDCRSEIFKDFAEIANLRKFNSPDVAFFFWLNKLTSNVYVKKSISRYNFLLEGWGADKSGSLTS